MATGQVKWYDSRKGFGFICPDLGPADVFVHASAVAEAGLASLIPGQRVEFELTQGGDGRLIGFALRLIPA